MNLYESIKREPESLQETEIVYTKEVSCGEDSMLFTNDYSDYAAIRAFVQDYAPEGVTEDDCTVTKLEEPVIADTNVNDGLQTETEEKPFLRNKATGETLTKSEVEAKWEEQSAYEQKVYGVSDEDWDFPFEKYLSDLDETGEWEIIKEEELAEAVVLPNLNQLLKEINDLKIYAEPVEDDEGITIKTLDGIFKADPDGLVTFTAEWLPERNKTLTFKDVNEFMEVIRTLSKILK